MGPRTAVLGVRYACGRSHWGLRWSALGHETLHWVGETQGGGGGGPRNAVLGARHKCDGSTGTFGGAPYGATKRCT
eukprot:1259534-Pyramimonas_sp.AAC.1